MTTHPETMEEKIKRYLKDTPPYMNKETARMYKKLKDLPEKRYCSKI